MHYRELLEEKKKVLAVDTLPSFGVERGRSENDAVLLRLLHGRGWCGDGADRPLFMWNGSFGLLALLFIFILLLEMTQTFSRRPREEGAAGRSFPSLKCTDPTPFLMFAVCVGIGGCIPLACLYHRVFCDSTHRRGRRRGRAAAFFARCVGGGGLGGGIRWQAAVSFRFGERRIEMLLIGHSPLWY